MEREGLLRSRKQVVGGRARRVYRATAEGRQVLARTRTALRELADEVLEQKPDPLPANHRLPSRRPAGSIASMTTERLRDAPGTRSSSRTPTSGP